MPTPPIMSEGAVEGGAGGGGMSTPGGGTLLEDQNGEGSASQLDIHAGAATTADVPGSPGRRSTAPRWAPIVDLPIGRCGHTAVVIQGSLYVFGGFSSFRDLHQFNIGKIPVLFCVSFCNFLLSHVHNGAKQNRRLGPSSSVKEVCPTLVVTTQRWFTTKGCIFLVVSTASLVSMIYTNSNPTPTLLEVSYSLTATPYLATPLMLCTYRNRIARLDKSPLSRVRL